MNDPAIPPDPSLRLADEHRLAGRLHPAELLYRQILAIDPHHPDALHGMAAIALAVGRNDIAADFAQRALEITPDADFYHTLALALQAQNHIDPAIHAFRAALQLAPHHPKILTDLGTILKDRGQLDDAIALFHSAIQHQPDYAEAHFNLALVYQGQGELQLAIASLRTAIQHQPDHAAAYSRLLLLLHCDPACDALALRREHDRWNQQFAAHLARSIPPHTNDPNPDRRLRIGYVSQDFRQQPTAIFFLLLLQAHNRSQVEVICYGNVRWPDVLTDHIRRQADLYRSTIGLSDEQVVDLIRQDQIDILVDLSLHTLDNRLPVFARKPAPIQATYLGYCSTTGLTTIDYRITDPYLDPPGCNHDHYSEESFRLPETYWCYQPLITLPVMPSPAQTKGYVTFGCMNNFAKVTAPTLAAFCSLLKTFPNSRFILHVREGSHCQNVKDYFAREGIESHRLEFVGYIDLRAHLQIYHRIDIALDTFPYGGGTTTCDALYLGVPVVTLAGQTAVGRGGVSILSNVGLPDLIAQSPEDYVRIAATLARDLPRLAHLRSTLRQTMEQSPLMDAPRFARNLENAYRQMWRRWCEKHSPSNSSTPS